MSLKLKRLKQHYYLNGEAQGFASLFIAQTARLLLSTLIRKQAKNLSLIVPNKHSFTFISFIIVNNYLTFLLNMRN